MNTVKAEISKITLPTYSEGRLEEMPMFAENRVHQRTSGNPYPCKVVTSVCRDKKQDKDYTCITLENKYLRIELLPELGGRIYSALDKRTGYDFFYKQHVIKPALIGCLGSWISGGVEFNWPFHHRASTFMPVDYEIEKHADGGVTVWLCEHEPMSRMKGMTGIHLSPDEAIFETRMRLFNRTPHKHSFLWWENAAVPVNPNYRIFFPEDVNYVNFHYKRSVTTYPIANNALGVFNGIRYNGDVDISYHKNTVQPTSYFSAPSEFDFFGGYDEGKKCGVIHVADHRISPGKKMFTWAYNQLSQTWENALTDEDGAYAELMAGSYSDNQPDFAWLEPYEQKSFSQYWFPYSDLGTPSFANTFGIIKSTDSDVVIRGTKTVKNVNITVCDSNNAVIFTSAADLSPEKDIVVPIKLCRGMSIKVKNSAETLMEYKKSTPLPLDIPETTKDMPNHTDNLSAEELYLCGVHVFQYRDPAVSPDAYWKEALRRDPGHINSLVAMADFCLRHMDFTKAYEYITRAESIALKFNKHPESGKLFYTKGLVLTALGNLSGAYDAFEKATWNADFLSASFTHLSRLDGILGNYDFMHTHASEAVDANRHNSSAKVLSALSLYALGKEQKAKELLTDIINEDKINPTAKCLLCALFSSGKELETTVNSFETDINATMLDVYLDLAACGFESTGRKILAAVEGKTAMTLYILGDTESAKNAPVGIRFPSHPEEYVLLEKLYNSASSDDYLASYLFGCINYANRHYDKAKECFTASSHQNPSFYTNYRNLAALEYSHGSDKSRSLSLIEKALLLNKNDSRLVFENAYLLNKQGKYSKAAQLVEATPKASICDETVIELAKAYNLDARHEDAINLLKSHSFVACEGGEHAIADQYMQAHFALGRKAFSEGLYEKALTYFTDALTLPQNLGSGLWNECKTLPYRFYQALCHTKTGSHEKAKEIFDWILCLKVDYFSDMHLPELACYQAKVLLILGKYFEARAILDDCTSKWCKSLDVKDPGFFGTTPFFNPYIENPREARKAKYSYLLGHAYSAMAQADLRYADKAKSFFDTAKQLDKTNLMAHIEREFI